MAPAARAARAARASIMLLRLILWICWCRQVTCIFGGRQIENDEYFWFAAIRINGLGAVCGASLVGARHVVTAHYCIDPDTVLAPRNKSMTDIQVEVGYFCHQINNCGRFFSPVGVERIFEHPGHGELAILQLAHPISHHIRPVVPYLRHHRHPHHHSTESETNQRQHERLKLIGAGRVGTHADATERVKKLKLVLMPPQECLQNLSDASLLTSNSLCSKASKSGGAPCGGDGGGPLVVPGKGPWEGRDILVGVHNFGPRECSKDAGHVFVHFDISKASSFLRSVVCEGKYPPADWCIEPTTNVIAAATPSPSSPWPTTDTPSQSSIPSTLPTPILFSMSEEETSNESVSLRSNGRHRKKKRVTITLVVLGGVLLLAMGVLVGIYSAKHLAPPPRNGAERRAIDTPLPRSWSVTSFSEATHLESLKRRMAQRRRDAPPRQQQQ